MYNATEERKGEEEAKGLATGRQELRICPENKGKWSVARGINIYHVGNVHQIVMKGVTNQACVCVGACLCAANSFYALSPPMSCNWRGAISVRGPTWIDWSFITSSWR